MVTKLSPKRLQSLMMGVWFASFSLANLCAGLLAAFSTKMDTSRHLVPLNSDCCYADVRVDSRSRELRVILVEQDGQTPLPIREKTVAFQIVYRMGDDGEQQAEVVLGAEPQSGDPEGTSSQFNSAGTTLPPEIDDIEDVRGRLIVTIDEEQLEGELVHEHYTFVFEGLAGFYLLLVVVPLAAGLLITLLTPLLKRMMHGIH